MDATSRNTASEMFISTRPRKNRNRINGNTDLISGNGSDITPISIKPKTEPSTMLMEARKVPVLYYLTRNGHLEHPHLIDVPLSSPHHALYLRDVINTLNHHRGKGMANMYSWSFKRYARDLRSYKSGYVWHDLSEDDLIESTNGHDYVLKGSELLEAHDLQIPTPASPTAGDNCSSTAATTAAMVTRQRNQSWSSFDNPQEYMVVKCESSRELAARFAADAGTQTEEEQRRRRRSFDGGERKGEIPSPPPSNSSSEEVSEGAKYVVDRTVDVRDGDPTADDEGSGNGRMKASQIVMQLISCGAPSRLKMQKE